VRKEVIGNATLYLGDCREILPVIGRVGAVVTDPPYSAEAHSPGRRVMGRTEAGSDYRVRKLDASPLDFDMLDDDMRDFVCRWSAEQCDGWLLAFCQAEQVSGWRESMETAGAAWRRAMVWVKPDSSPQLSGDRPAQGYESIASAWCGGGRSRWNGGGRRGVFTFGKHDPGMGHGGRSNEHPTQKPVGLMVELLDLFTNRDTPVVDMFMGSGTTGVACHNLGRPFIGIEQKPAYFDIACRRIEDAQRQGRLIG
jgi:site-specific DNA-methyltransferase (adenine-specific)